MPATSARLLRSLGVSALALIALFFLSSCSDGTPISPTSDLSREPSFTAKPLRGKVAIKVAHKAKILSNGNVEIGVRAVCPRGYVREESGGLRIDQGFASGEGSVQLQLGGCTGRWQSGTTVVFSFSETPFRPGRARVSVTFTVVNPNDPDGEHPFASVDQTVRLR
jgi:hypothetical protein